MIVPIVIDTQDMMSQFSLTRNQVDDVCDNLAKTLAARYAQELEKSAQRELHQTRQRYIRNIKVVDSGRLEGTVMLDYSKDRMVQMLEEGASAFDMKDGLLNGPRAKITKKGKRYNTVPFRIGNPNAVADADVFSGTLPKSVYKAIRKIPQTIPVAGGGMRTAGISPMQLPSAFSQAGSRKSIVDSAGKVLFKEYEHKTSIYAGMVQQSDPTTGQNRYFSFRRVSEKSDPDAFIHPGIEQHNLIQKTLGEFDQTKELSNALDIEWQKLGF
jgi:hypothetical protein